MLGHSNARIISCLVAEKISQLESSFEIRIADSSMKGQKESEMRAMNFKKSQLGDASTLQP
jgi:CHAD domain-containing protein